MISGALPNVAGLCGDHNVVIMDEAVEPIDWDAIPNFDIVGVTGMNVQKVRMKQILLRLKELDVFTLVGGSFMSVKEDFFDGLCDVAFVGEAETTLPEFLDDFSRGRKTKKRYEQSERTDMTKAARPRYDLLKVIVTRPERCSSPGDVRSNASFATSS